MGILDKAKDMLGGAGASGSGAPDLGAITDKANAAGLDPEQIKGLIAKFTGGDGKFDLNGLLEAAKGLGLDPDKVKGLFS